MSDPFMQDQIKELIGNGECAEAAVDSVCDMFVSMFSQVDDELTRQRATDVGDIRIRMLKILTNTPDVNISEVPAGTIIVAKDLTPSMTAGIVKRKCSWNSDGNWRKDFPFCNSCKSAGDSGGIEHRWNCR